MRNVLLASLLLVGAAGCRFEGDPKTDAIPASCAPVSFACGDHADCCSYACAAGACIPNVVAGGVCRTSDDCDASMTCVGGQCTPGSTCRQTPGDTCTANSACCSGNCDGENNSVYPPIAGSCQDNHAPVVLDVGPVVQPFFATTTLSTIASDQDAGDSLYYVWRLTQAPAGHGLGTSWSASGAHPAVFLAAAGTYVFTVTVTDGILGTQRGRLSDSGTVTIHAQNLPPVVSAGDDVPSLLRNGSMAISGTVMDPNGAATAVTCAWYAKPPTGAEAMLGAPRSPCWAATHGATFAPGIDAEQGPWSLRLEAFDGEFVTSDVRIVNVTNAPPVPNACQGCAPAPFARVVNLPAPGTPQRAPIALVGAATDQNGDVGTPGFTWTWTVTEQDGVALPAPIVVGTADGTAPPFVATFEPTAAGTYAAVLSLDDGHGGAVSATVVVRVEPWLRPLLPRDGAGLPYGSIADATWFHAAVPADDLLVFAGRDAAAGANRLWALDPEASTTADPAATPSAALGASPLCLTVSPSGSEVLVGESGPYWQRIGLSSGTPSSPSGLQDFGFGWSSPPTDLVDEGTREYAVFANGAVRELGASGGATPITCDACTAAGTRAVATTDYLWLLDDRFGELRRFLIRPNGNLQLTPNTAVTGLTTSRDLWLSALHGASRDVAVAGGPVFDALTLTSIDGFTDGDGHPVQARHLDTAAPGGALEGVLVRADGGAVLTLDGSYAETGRIPIPALGYQGTGYPLEAVWAFVQSDGTRWVVLRSAGSVGPAGASSVRWFLLKE